MTATQRRHLGAVSMPSPYRSRCFASPRPKPTLYQAALTTPAQGDKTSDLQNGKRCDSGLTCADVHMLALRRALKARLAATPRPRLGRGRALALPLRPSAGRAPWAAPPEPRSAARPPFSGSSRLCIRSVLRPFARCALMAWVAAAACRIMRNEAGLSVRGSWGAAHKEEPLEHRTAVFVLQRKSRLEAFPP